MPTRVFIAHGISFTLIFITWRYYAGELTSPSIVFYENTPNIAVFRKGVDTFKAV